MRLVVVGQGSGGLPLAMRAVEAGYRVVSFDTDCDRVKCLIAGESQIEGVAAAVREGAVRSGRYDRSGRSEDCAGFDIAVIAVPNPLRDGAPDLTHIEAAGHTLARHVRRNAGVRAKPLDMGALGLIVTLLWIVVARRVGPGYDALGWLAASLDGRPISSLHTTFLAR
jgi:hypothetical protein